MRVIWILLIYFLLLCSPAHAQQAIVTMPSADVTEPGRIFVMNETQLRAWSRPSVNSTYFFTYGLGYHTELALTLFNLAVPSVDNMTLAVGYKSVLPLLPRRLPDLELKLTQGAMLLQSLSGRGTGYWIYGHASLRLPLLRTRIAAGLSAASEQLYEERAVSFIASLEQPVAKGVYLTAEWFSGDHDLSNLIVGVTYHPGPRWLAVLGYKVPTQDRRLPLGEQALVGELGLFF